MLLLNGILVYIKNTNDKCSKIMILGSLIICTGIFRPYGDILKILNSSVIFCDSWELSTGVCGPPFYFPSRELRVAWIRRSESLGESHCVLIISDNMLYPQLKWGFLKLLLWCRYWAPSWLWGRTTGSSWEGGRIWDLPVEGRSGPDSSKPASQVFQKQPESIYLSPLLNIWCRQSALQRLRRGHG